MTVIGSINTANAAPGLPGGPAVSVCSFARPNDANAYTAGDVVSDSTADAVALVFPNVGLAGVIESATLCYEETDTASFTLWLFDAEPTNFVDNAALALVTGDMPKILCKFTFADGDKKTVGTQMNFYESEPYGASNAGPSGYHPQPYAAPAGKLYGLLVSDTSHTPAAQAKITIKLGIGRRF